MGSDKAPAAHDFTIVTAADQGYFDLLNGLIASLRALPEAAARTAPIAVLDLGLTEEQRARLARSVTGFVEPGWDYDFPGRAAKPGGYKAFTARPFLPDHVPGYRTYLWIDADAWVQDWSVLALYLEVARDGKLAITTEIDRCYQTAYKWQRPRWNTLTFRQYRQCFGWRAANRLGRNPFVNSGVFALTADAPHWALWQAALGRAIQRSQDGLVEQTALNYVVYHDRPPVGMLPAWCNWMCVTAPPMVDEATGLLVEPQPPHRTLGVVHLLGPIKDKVYRLQTRAGGTIERTLRYQTPSQGPGKFSGRRTGP